ncbi:hypothetical protein HPB48_008132 [Haemaphysalis longicornis]|uniref:USP domain-containing protein n=1 Tax=Haemaphysalis longicornis TaxID=44386 RepID=A0A9J6FWF3_HAELO|nr:hypothetical protein HPB48_008132 [Haemaphysalis longicornis]
MSPYTFTEVMEQEGSLATGSGDNPDEVFRRPAPATYDLTGVVVHNGQASAGHYYSYIRERRSDPRYVARQGQWYKFNDTTVEQFDLNDSTLETECFGGTYKAKVSDSASCYPETRQRHWNAYLLFYEKQEPTRTPRTPHKTPGRFSFRRDPKDSPPIKWVVENFFFPPGYLLQCWSWGQLVTAEMCANLGKKAARKHTKCFFGLAFVLLLTFFYGYAAVRSAVRRTPSASSAAAATASSRQRGDSLSQLTRLVDHGERQGWFPSHMPPHIGQQVREQNLLFARNRDVYNTHYFDFVAALTSVNMDNIQHPEYEQLMVQSLNLAVNFFLNTYLKYKKKDRYSAAGFVCKPTF